MVLSKKAEMGELPIFDLAIPKALPGVDSAILDPRVILMRIKHNGKQK